MTHEWLLKRNCSLSPYQVARAYGALCAAVLAIGAAFALQGVWFVFAFALVETGAVLLALLHYARHATDREHIALSDSCLLIERIEGGRVHAVRLDPCWTRVIVPGRRRSLIRLEARGVKVEVGSFVCEEARLKVAQELRRELRATSLLS